MNDHHKRIHHPLDYERLHKYLQPIYERLTDTELLSRCKLHLTQNANESFHSAVWSHCSKEKNHSLQQVQFAVTTAWATFNFGPQALNSLDQVYGMDVGECTLQQRKRKEAKRLEKSLWVEAGNEKRRRQKVDAGRSRAQREDSEVSYGAGLF